MRMKQWLLLPVLLWITLVTGQHSNIQIQESKIYKLTTARVQNDFMMPDGQGGFISIASKRSGFLVNPLIFEAYATQYDQNLNQVKTKTFKLNKGSVKGAIKGAFVQDGQLILLKMETNFRKKYYAFKRIRGNINTGEVNEKEFFRLNFIYPKNEVNLFINPGSLYSQKLKYYTDVNFFNPKMFFIFSKNNRFFSIIYRDKTTNTAIYHIQVFNSNFEPVYQQEIRPNVLPELFYINDLKISDGTGTVYLAGQIFKTDPLKKNRLINTDNTKEFVIYQINKTGVENYRLKPKKVIEKLHLALGKELVAYGFYRHKYLNLNDIDGFYRLNLTLDLAMINESYQAFEHQLVTVSHKKSIKKTKNHSVIVRNHFLLEDGSLIVNAEDLYVPLLMKKEDREENVREIAGDLFSIKISSNGAIQYAVKIYKKQVVKPRLALHSFFSTYINDKNYIIFTDSPLEKPKDDVPFYLLKKELNNLNMVVISNNGTVQKSVIKKYKRGNKFRFMPIEGVMTNPDTAIIPAKDHLYIKFSKLIFN